MAEPARPVRYAPLEHELATTVGIRRAHLGNFGERDHHCRRPQVSASSPHRKEPLHRSQGAEIRLRVLALAAEIERNGYTRGSTDPQLAMLTTLSTEDLIPVDHPIRKIRVVVDAVLAEMDRLKAWASHKSFKPNDGPPSPPPPGRNTETDFHGEKRSNATHTSTTDPESRLARKSSAAPAKLSYAARLLIEHRNALIVDAELTQASGYAERDAAIVMLERLPKRSRRRTIAGDKGYDTKDFVDKTRRLGFTPHVAAKRRHSSIDARTTRHPGHAVSQRIRKRVEEPFGWMKTVAGGRKLRYNGRRRNRAWFLITSAVYNMIRITDLDTNIA